MQIEMWPIGWVQPSLFGTQPEQYQLLAEHRTAEYPITTTGRDRTVEE